MLLYHGQQLRKVSAEMLSFIKNREACRRPGGKRILPIVTNSMTDRCATKLKVNKLLNELKKRHFKKL